MDYDDGNSNYNVVPGKGERLADGSYWSECQESIKVGDILTTHHYFTKYDSNRETYFSKPNVCKCVEVSTFGGVMFARWESVESEWREAIKHTNQQMDYK